MALSSHFNGYIGKDGAQIKESKKGNKYLVMDVATDYYENGENKTQWIRVYSTVPKHLGKFGESLKKGSHIKVEGEQRTRAYTGRDGEAHAAVEIFATLIEYVKSGNGKRQGESSQTTRQETASVTQNPKEQDAPFPAPADNTDDLPF